MPGKRDGFESILVGSYVALAMVAAYQGTVLDTFLGGLFANWWARAYLLLPALIAIPMSAAWFRRKPVFLYLVAATAYWLFASSGYVAMLLHDGELVTGRATDVVAVAVVTVSLWYIGRHFARRTAKPT